MAEVSNSKLFQPAEGTLPMGAFAVMVKTEWNSAVIDRLEEGCAGVLSAAGVKHRTITVPGAFEIAFAIKQYWEAVGSSSERPHAFIALGCVIRGGTPHFEYVCQAVTQGIVELNLRLPVPVIFGVLTLDNQQQAEERTGGVHGHKGEEAAITAIKMMQLPASFRQQQT